MIGRRHVLAGGVAVLAAGAGIGWSLWRGRADDGLWSLRFPAPGGGEVVLAERRGRPLVLNFWATWCPPCVREMPALDRFQARWAARGWQVLGLAVDSEAAVREFLQRSPVRYPIGLAGFQGAELARSLGNSSGGLPFTLVFDTAGRVRQRKLGETSEAELEAWASEIHASQD